MSAFSRKFKLGHVPVYIKSFWNPPDGWLELNPHSDEGYDLILGRFFWTQLLAETNIISTNEEIRELITDELESKKIYVGTIQDKPVNSAMVRRLVIRLHRDNYCNQARMLANCNSLIISGKHLCAISPTPANYDVWLSVKASQTSEDYQQPILTYVKGSSDIGWPTLIGTVSRCLRERGEEDLAAQFRDECLAARDLDSGLDVALRYVKFRAILEEDIVVEEPEDGATGYYCRLSVKSKETGEVITTEGLSQVDLMTRMLPDAAAIESHLISMDDDGTPHHKIIVEKYTVKNFALFYAPFIMRTVENSGVHTCLKYMKDVLEDVFAEARPLVMGQAVESSRVKHRGFRNTSTYLIRMLRAWDEMAKPLDLEEYVWARWLEVIGDGAIGLMPRGAPTPATRVATFVSDYTRNARYPRIG